MIVLFTDYGTNGPYLGEVEAAIYTTSPGEKVIRLFTDLPRQNQKAAAYLLSAYVDRFPANTIFFCVVDPAVGREENKPVICQVDDRWYVGPNNGLFDLLIRHGKKVSCWEITWRPDLLSNTFHGRDMYAPVSAMLARGEAPPGQSIEYQDRNNWPDELPEIIYFDGFGNAMSGLYAKSLQQDVVISLADHNISRAVTYAEVSDGQVFWYENSVGLLEIAVNGGSAKDMLAAYIGQKIKIIG